MLGEADYSAFLGRAKEISAELSEQARKGSNFLAISHHDADGLSSASIIGLVLARLKVQFTIRIVEELREDNIGGIAAIPADVFIFTDIGSGYFELLAEHLQNKKVFVFDHHPASSPVPPNVIHLNPHEFGIDGARLVSAAGVCYFVGREVSERNRNLSGLAVVGALGDMQDKNDKRALAGMNELIVEDGIKSGVLGVDSDLVLYGRETRPIHRSLAFTTTPYLPNLSGREDNCLALLSSNAIRLKEGERFRTIADLTQEEKQTLMNAIISHLSSLGFQSSVVLDMVGSVYTLTKESPGSSTRDAREFSALLNACGRTGNPSIGLGVGLGDRRTALEEANEVVNTYRKTLAAYMEWLTKTPEAVQKFQAIWVVRGENQINESMTGAFSSILSSAGTLSPDHATIVMTRAKDGGFKMSARLPAKLVKMGVNLGAALNVVAKNYSGFGGGHNVAAGAHIKVDDPLPFLKELDETILLQMKTVHAS